MKLDAAIAYVGGDYGPTPRMLTNIIFRFSINLAAAIACWVPMRLFHRNRELAGTSMVAATAVLNFYYALNAAIWHDDDVAGWFRGYGWCDVQLASFIPLETLNAGAICAVMHNISNQVSLMRAAGLTGQERRRKQVMQALIIFPIPALQALLYYFSIARRYNISGIIGCQAVFTGNWVFLTFFLLPCPVFAVLAAYFAALAWWRYRKVDTISRRALYCSGSHHGAGGAGGHARGARTKRKLYFMALTIVAPYCPMQLVFLFNNVKLGFPWSQPYEFSRLHGPGWGDIDYAPSTRVSFVSMYINYMAALEVLVFFLYFGRTEEAHDMYRGYLRALGLGRLFPRLSGGCPRLSSWGDSMSSSSARSFWPRNKGSISSVGVSTHSRASSIHKARARIAERPLNQDDDDGTKLFRIRLNSLDLEAARAVTDKAPSSHDAAPRVPPRSSSWLFRTDLAPHFEFPKLPGAALFSSSGMGNEEQLIGHDKPIATESRPHQPAVTHLSRPSRPRPAAVRSVAHHPAGTADNEVEQAGRANHLRGDGTRASAKPAPVLGRSYLRYSEYERMGLVSTREDFSSSKLA